MQLAKPFLSQSSSRCSIHPVHKYLIQKHYHSHSLKSHYFVTEVKYPKLYTAVGNLVWSLWYLNQSSGITKAEACIPCIVICFMSSNLPSLSILFLAAFPFFKEACMDIIGMKMSEEVAHVAVYCICGHWSNFCFTLPLQAEVSDGQTDRPSELHTHSLEQLAPLKIRYLTFWLCV